MPTAIVAIPRVDDYVWRISSEKIPHMTLCFLGEPGWDDSELQHATDYVEHTASLLKQFGMGVERRGELGAEEGPKADVLFLDKGWNRVAADTFRSNLLADPTIKTAYNSTEQHDRWIPHVTLGWPDRPAKPDNRDYPGINWIQFDKVALWTGDYSGPTFELKSEFSDDYGDVAMKDLPSSLDDVLEHYGVKGMKWGVRRRSRPSSPASADSQRVSALKTSAKSEKSTKHFSNSDLEDAIKRMRLEQEFSRLSGNVDKTRRQKSAAFVKKVLSDTGQQVVKETVKNEASAAVKAQMDKQKAA